MTPASLFLLVGAALIGSSSCHKSSLRHLQEITPPPSPGSTNNDIISPIPTPAPFLLTTSWGPTMPPVPAPTPDPTGGGPTLQTPVPTPDPTDEGPTPPPTPYPTSLPPNFEFGLVGCFSDDPNDRLLTGNSWKMDSSMTTEKCAEQCEGSTYFGTEYGEECFCGTFGDELREIGGAVCDFECGGDSSQTCGGRNAISVHTYSPRYSLLGCYGDSQSNRVLSGDSFKNNPDTTAELCATFCDGSPYFGTEYGRECYCGVDGDAPDELGLATCDMECGGDAAEICGGNNAISVYAVEDVGIVIATPVGCYKDDRNDRIMAKVVTDVAMMTLDVCESACYGYAYFGTQYGTECWCSDSHLYARHGESDNCDYTCVGDAEQYCGGYNAMSVWEYYQS